MGLILEVGGMLAILDNQYILVVHSMEVVLFTKCLLSEIPPYLSCNHSCRFVVL